MEINLQDIIQKSILNSELILKPFPHLVVDNLLPENFFEELKNYVKDLKNIERYTIVPGRWYIKPKNWDSYLKILKNVLYNEETKKILNDKFKIQLEKRKEYLTESIWDINLTYDLSGYEIPPHMDGPSKQLSVLYYITGSINGTSLYDNGDSLDYTQAKKVSEIKFKENRLFVFCPSIYDRTWHGVENTPEKMKRITIQGNLDLVKDPKIKWHSFGIGSIRYKYKKRSDNFI